MKVSSFYVYVQVSSCPSKLSLRPVSGVTSVWMIVGLLGLSGYCSPAEPASPLRRVHDMSPCIIGRDWNAAPLMFIVICPRGMWMLTQKSSQLVKSSAIWPSWENVSAMNADFKQRFTMAVNRNVLLTYSVQHTSVGSNYARMLTFEQ